MGTLLNETALRQNETFRAWWYSTMELLPGVYTNGQRFDNIAPLRQLLRGVNVAGTRALDIGAMEGLISILLCRRGARHVIAYDRMPNPEKIHLVKQYLACAFNYHHGLPFSRLRDLLKR